MSLLARGSHKGSQDPRLDLVKMSCRLSSHVASSTQLIFVDCPRNPVDVIFFFFCRNGPRTAYIQVVKDNQETLQRRILGWLPGKKTSDGQSSCTISPFTVSPKSHSPRVSKWQGLLVNLDLSASVS